MLFFTLVTIILIHALFFGLKRISFHGRERWIYLLPFLALFFLNGLFTYRYIQVKNSHNYSTYISYQLTLDQIQQISNLAVTDVSGIRELKDRIEILSKQTGLLAEQLNHTRLIKGDNEPLLSCLNWLTAELSTFTVYHNQLFAQGKEIPADEFHRYEALVADLSKFHDALFTHHQRAGGNLGINRYQISYQDDQLKQLEKYMEAISDSISTLVSE